MRSCCLRSTSAAAGCGRTVSLQQVALRMEQANHLVVGGALPPPAELTAETTCALGWALKDLCYSSWSSEPQRAVHVAGALRRLRDAARAAAVPAALPEVDALVAWTDGIARVIQGEMEAATASLDAAAAAFAELGQPRHAAQTQVPKIMALAMLGRHDDAAHCAEAAQRALLENGDLHAASKVSLNLGNLHLRADRYSAAAERFREAAVLFERVGDSEHSVMADNGLADALTALGDLDEAARTYARARLRACTHAFSVLEALVEESVALLDLVRGRYRDALAGLEGSRRRYAELEMPQHLAIAEKQLADAYLELRLLPESLAGYEAALERFKTLDMQVDRAWTLVQRGRALALAGQRAAAAASLAEAAPLFVALDNTAGAAAVALAQAELALAGADGAQALALAREAAGRFQRAGLMERQLRAESVQAQALLHLGDVALARSLFDATLDAARKHQLLPVQLRCLTGRAMAARAAGDRQAAREDLEAAADLFEDQRRTLPGDEVRSAFQCDHLLPFQELLRLELEAHAEGGADAADVLAQLDRFRARTLADRLGMADRDHDEGEAQQAGTQDLRAHLAWLYRRLHRLHDEAGASTDGDRRAAGDRTRAARTHAQDPPCCARPQPRCASMPSWTSGRCSTRSSPATHWSSTACRATSCSPACVTRAGVQVKRRLAAWPQVIDAVRSVRFQVETLRHGSAPVQRHLPTLELRVHAHLQRLHALVWQPLEPLLGDPQRVLIVPHAQLGSVPFAALHDGERCVAEQLADRLRPERALRAARSCARAQAAVRVLALGESTRLPQRTRSEFGRRLLPQGQAFVGEEATIENLHGPWRQRRCDPPRLPRPVPHRQPDVLGAAPARRRAHRRGD